MKEILDAILNGIGRPKTFADAILISGNVNKGVLDDLISLLSIEVLKSITKDELKLEGKVPLAFSLNCKRIDRVKDIKYSEWISLCKTLDISDMGKYERDILLIAVSLIALEQFDLATILFSLYLLDTV